MNEEKVNQTIDSQEKVSQIRKNRRLSLLFILIIIQFMSGMNMLSAAFYMKPEKIKSHLTYILMFFIIYLVIGTFSRAKLGLTYRILSNRKLNIFIFLSSTFILLIMLVGSKLGLSFIPRINGAYGWLNIMGFTIQPSEILKIAFIINLANALSKFEDKKENDITILINTLLYLLVYAGLIILQKDMGTAIHYLFIWAFMVFCSNIRIKWIKIGVVFGGIISSISAYYIYKLVPNENTSYKIMRIKSYIDGIITGEYSNDIGYQVKQSVYAFGSGGTLGKGYANGVQKYSYLPEIHTDFIMATFGEEFGLIGMLIILILFLILYLSIIRVIKDIKNSFGRYLTFGIASLIITQVILNLFISIGLLPVFGLPMPFFSYGGSSMLTMAIAVLIVDNIIATTYS